VVLGSKGEVAVMASSSGATRRLWGWLEPSSSRGECLLSSGERWW
jgi:hypothetical protein